MIAFNFSIRRQLLCWLMIPIIVILAVDTFVANIMAVEFANDAYDDSLIDSASAVASRINFDAKSGRPVLDLSKSALSFLKSNQKNKIYYQVLDSDGRCIAGENTIPPPTSALSASEPDVHSGKVKNQKVRIASLITKSPDGSNFYIVQLAETTVSRNELIRTIILMILLPQLAIIAFTAGVIWFGVRRGLMPLRALESSVSRRSPTDLKPLSEAGSPKEVKPLVASINHLLERVRDDREAQKRFIANAAHQLRTPLAGLKTQSQLALRLKDPGELHHAVKLMGSSAERANRLVNQLLTLARVAPTRYNRQAPICLEEIACHASSEVVPQAVAKNIDLGFECNLSSSVIEGDSENLHEMMVNLIENAVIYTPEGGKVTVSLKESKAATTATADSAASAATSPTLVFAVEDNGPGIPEEERERVFERFYRVLGSGAAGSGLGLSIVHEIALKHGASVCISTGINGCGTRVEVSFPSFVSGPVVNAPEIVRVWLG